MDIQSHLRDRQIIHSDLEIMSGTPVFVGTRVPLQTFFDYLEGEAGLAEFLEDFPHLQTQVLIVLEAIAIINAGSGANCTCSFYAKDNLLSKKLSIECNTLKS
ncbi:DUF433 domain-containing protein [Scytonema hofmannii]|uniref:DUF433 domain-containing protein n=1 Tax=Scytonema hofmannii TaxID=34078 RepID=UPI000349EB36|nr:DUF433 domain-containing protein [Scytonema hofmannii]